MLGILLGVFFLVFLEVQLVLGIWYLGVVAFDLLLDFFFRMFFCFMYLTQNDIMFSLKNPHDSFGHLQQGGLSAPAVQAVSALR